MAFVRILCVSMITALSTLGSSSMALADDHTVTIYAWGDNYLT